MTRRPSLLLLILVVAALLAGCAGASGSPTPIPPPTQGPVATPQEAVAAVVRREPRLTGIRPFDPDVIGQSAGYEVVAAPGFGDFIVSVRVGWGDCPAGCISEHTWVYAVQSDGVVTLQSEGGDVVPADAWPSPGGDGRTGLAITATAGPTCPVERIPPDRECAPRVVPGAVVVVRDATGAEVARVTLDAGGFAFLELPAGAYQVEGLAVTDLMGAPAPAAVTVVAGASTAVALGYETGIR